jgi:hypothetical protein
MFDADADAGDADAVGANANAPSAAHGAISNNAFDLVLMVAVPFRPETHPGHAAVRA